MPLQNEYCPGWKKEIEMETYIKISEPTQLCHSRGQRDLIQLENMALRAVALQKVGWIADCYQEMHST